MSALRTAYIRFKFWLPEPIRDTLSAVNQRLFARWLLRRKYGKWFDVDWRKKFQSLSAEEWKRAYDEAWRHRKNDCVEEVDEEMILEALGRRGSMLEVGWGRGHSSLVTRHPLHESVLEVGCGIGSLAMRLAKEGFEVTGMDVSGEALKIARERATGAGLAIRWQEGFAERMPFPDKSFDYITCCHTIEHVRDLEGTASELKRVARKKIIILTPKQKFRMYAEHYHTQFFEKEEDLIDAFRLPHYRCSEVDCIDRENQFQGKAWFYVGSLE